MFLQHKFVTQAEFTLELGHSCKIKDHIWNNPDFRPISQVRFAFFKKEVTPTFTIPNLPSHKAYTIFANLCFCNGCHAISL